MKKTCKILGTQYVIITEVTPESMPDGADGCIDQSINAIKIAKFEEPTINDLQDIKSYENKVLRHEIIHAFLYESGLWNNSGSVDSWATNEEMVDWMAIQFPKIQKVFEELGCQM